VRARGETVREREREKRGIWQKIVRERRSDVRGSQVLRAGVRGWRSIASVARPTLA
jgi:hypothetical protein